MNKYKLRNEDIDRFVLMLSDHLNLVLPPEKHMGNFFDNDENYLPLDNFCHAFLDEFIQKEDNYN